MTALWPRVASPKAQQVAWTAPVQGYRLAGSTKHRFTGHGAAQAQANRINVLFGLHHRPVVRVEAPHPGMIDLRVAEFQQPRVGAPEGLVLVHLEQPLMDARVHAGGVKGLDLQALACQGVLGRGRASDTERAGPWMASSVPERTLRQRSSRSARASSSRPTRSCAAFVRRVGDEARKGVVSARVVLGHDRLGDRGAAHDAAGHEGGERPQAP